MTKLSTLLILLLATVVVVFGCGVVPQGQARSIGFTVSGFTLPAAMTYSTASAVSVQVPGIAPSPEAANSFVSRLMMQTVINVLELQGRSAGLPDAVISSILDQLMVRTTYGPLECKAVSVDPTMMIAEASMDTQPHCIILGSTVSAICTDMNCELSTGMKIENIAANYTSVSGTLTTTNFVMANWSRQMWQGVVDRAVRTLALGPFKSNFATAFATVS
ncbi:hypothetical protein KIN20_000545 [Parelaphostrongylus tenuis]|uniref:Uncharacterized protein n=1 Tax=Parelaphostrongylus tenuis TaxID=148309 RepID=A0AAD5QFM7_PARTN|nr:hypothetical protein KIN20_000545 [Parelaphostrongylus tenuis]